MDSISSIASSASAMIAKQTAELNKSASAAKTSFESILSRAKTALVGKPATGFSGGTTDTANSLTAQTGAAFTSAMSSVKSAVSIKPSTGFNN